MENLTSNSRFVLIDGHAILHRAFHALPPSLTAPNGMSTNAIHGFMNMLMKILADLKPDFLAVCFDLPAPTFRMQAYTQYQSKRPEMIGNLKDQIGPMHELLTALKIPFFEVKGFEADDCIGTLAMQASKSDSGPDFAKTSTGRCGQNDENVETIIVTGDRDMLQLVNEKVRVYVPIKGLSETKTYDEKLVESEFGVKPAQWVDVKALKGDASDNYPGVAGIGPKTACDLILRFGTLEKLYEGLGELGRSGGSGAKIAKKLAEGAESAGLGKKLATIVCDVPGVHLDLGEARVDKIDWVGGVRFMREVLGFKSLPEKIERTILKKPQNTNGKSAEREDELDFTEALPGEQMRLV